ncbi:hypothetical protein SASPL_110503 [Salvia splendens]|uniref:Ran guanine nucleotide release factor n=1 Tax=Salvia splendens TaxID=180675 RepID=A0A8X9A2F9_SALSN|nr:hypothetical protein SASPL_110503 [Salvia splendens]
MPADLCTQRPLFGGAISSTFPLRFQDVSNMRQVPDHQEVFVDPTRDESLIFELLDLKTDVADHGSATWFLQDLANEQDAEGATLFKTLSEKFVIIMVDVSFKLAVLVIALVYMMVLEQSGVFEADALRFRDSPAVITTAVGQMAISKGRQGRDAQNLVKVYLANLRLKDVGTDVLITAYEPMMINPLSESAATVGAGLAVPAAQSGCMPMEEVFRGAISSFKVNEWSLFGAVA